MFAFLPGRSRATKPAEIARLMPLHPNSRDIGKNTPPPRAGYPAPHTAVDTPSPLQNTPSHPDRDAVPHIVMGVQGRDYALQEPTDDHIVLATQRALTYARHLFRRGNCNNSILYYSERHIPPRRTDWPIAPTVTLTHFDTKHLQDVKLTDKFTS